MMTKFLCQPHDIFLRLLHLILQGILAVKAVYNYFSSTVFEGQTTSIPWAWISLESVGQKRMDDFYQHKVLFLV